MGFELSTTKDKIFDTVSFKGTSDLLKQFEAHGVNIGVTSSDWLHVSLNETTTMADIEDLVGIFSKIKGKSIKPSFEG